MEMLDPLPQFSYILSSLATNHPFLSYVHLSEPRVQGDGTDRLSSGQSIDFARKIWARTGRPFLVAGGFTPQSALEYMRNGEGRERDVVVFGRWFIANVSLTSIHHL